MKTSLDRTSSNRNKVLISEVWSFQSFLIQNILCTLAYFLKEIEEENLGQQKGAVSEIFRF